MGGERNGCCTALTSQTAESLDDSCKSPVERERKKGIYAGFKYLQPQKIILYEEKLRKEDEPSSSCKSEIMISLDNLRRISQQINILE